MQPVSVIMRRAWARPTTRSLVVATLTNVNATNLLRSVGPMAVSRRWSSNDTKPETSASSSTEGASTEATTEAAPGADKNEKVGQLEKEIKELKDRVMRGMAEEENVRRIAKRDVDNARAYAVTGFAKSLLDVADDFERALAAVPKSGAEGDPAVTLKTLATGIAMTEKTLQKAFTQHGVVKYGAVGDAFDPAMHDALFAAPANGDQKSGTISQVLKSGYKLKDRVLRPAEVGTVA